jgi:GTPase SAR1 family protein
LRAFDLGGGARIRDIWPRYYSETHGLVFVVDASETNAERVREARDALWDVVRHSHMLGKPVLVLSNKADLDGAVASETMASQLSLSQLAAFKEAATAFHVVDCSASGVSGKPARPKAQRVLREGLTWLMQAVEERRAELEPRRQRDMQEQAEIEQKERAAKRERVRLIREKREREQAEAEADVEATATETEACAQAAFGSSKSKTIEKIDTAMAQTGNTVGLKGDRGCLLRTVSPAPAAQGVEILPCRRPSLDRQQMQPLIRSRTTRVPRASK